MRRHAENARAQFFLKTVHHGEHHDQRHHAQRNARHRDDGNEGDEMVAALGVGVTQADQKLKGKQNATR